MRHFNKSSLLCCSLLLLSGKLVCAQEWFPVRGGIQSGVSGMALIEDPPIKMNPMLKSRGVLIVHDNKTYDRSAPGTKTEQEREFEKDADKRNNRLAIVRFEYDGRISYRPLEWPNPLEAPNDLEAISSIPGEKNAYVALTSKGQGYYLKLEDRKIELIEKFSKKSFTLPKPETGEKNGNFNFEGFSLQKVGQTTVAVWAERGNGKRLGQLFWSKFDANFPPAKATPLPIGFTYVSDNEPLRHVSDLKVDPSGALFVSAAADGGNNGLFNSYFYQAGQFAINGDQVNFSKAVAPTILYRFPNHKVEAFDMMPGPRGGVIFGTDDEP